MAFRIAVDTHNLIVRASIALGVTQREFANVIGTSHRTAQRMQRGQSVASDAQLRTLAMRLYPKNRELAAELAATAGTSLVALGAEAPFPPSPGAASGSAAQPAPSPPPRPRPPPRALVDSVVCAAAEAQEVMPDQIRAALLAAFLRGEELGLTMEEAAAALRPQHPPKEVPRRRVATVEESADVEAPESAEPAVVQKRRKR